MDDRSSASTFGALIDSGVLSVTDGYRAKNSELGGDGLLFLRAGHVTDTHIDFDGVDRFDNALAPKLADKTSRPGDVAVTTKGNSTGRTTFVAEDMPLFVYSPHLSRWRSLDHDILCPGFLRYWSRGREFVEQLHGMMVSTDMAPYLSLRDQRLLRITLPPIHEQQAIASVLGSLDDKIELNRRMNRTLEQMAAAIFKAWFVDFEPVRAKASGAASFPGMPQPVFDALRGTFADSELGPIPEGWEAVELGDQAEVIKGRSYKSSELEPSATALVTLKSFQRGGGYRPDGLKPYTGIYKPIQVVEPGELVVAYTDLTQSAEVIGKPAIVRGDSRFETLVASLDLGIVRPTNGLSVPYLYCLFRTDDFQTHVYGHSNGSTVLHLGKHGVPSYLMPLPPEGLREAFDNFAVPAFRMIDKLSSESAALAETRDALLPKLLSGEVRVPIAETEEVDETTDWPVPTHARLQEVGGLARELDAAGVPEWARATNFGDGRLQMPVLDNGPVIGRFEQLACKVALVVPTFDWGAWPDRTRYENDPSLLEQADLCTLQRLTTALVRGERFCEGTLSYAHSRGLLAAICRRAGELAESRKEQRCP